MKIKKSNPYDIKGSYILYLGVMNKEKGIYDLLQSIKNINSELDSNIKVILCGNDLVGNVKEIIKDYELEDRIKMAGWVNEDQRLNLFKNTMLNVLPLYI